MIIKKAFYKIDLSLCQKKLAFSIGSKNLSVFSYIEKDFSSFQKRNIYIQNTYEKKKIDAEPLKNKKTDFVDESMLYLVEKFVKFLMIDGKKIKAYNIFYQALNKIKSLMEEPLFLTQAQKNSEELSSKTQENNVLKDLEKLLNNKIKANRKVLTILSQAIDNVKPSLEVRKVRIAGITYIVPSLVSKKRQESLAIRWIIESAKKRKIQSKTGFSDSLSNEIIEASIGQGQARQKREELHKIAEANRAYIRYRWW